MSRGDRRSRAYARQRGPRRRSSPNSTPQARRRRKRPGQPGRPILKRRHINGTPVASAVAIMSATSVNSVSPKPRVASAGVLSGPRSPSAVGIIGDGVAVDRDADLVHPRRPGHPVGNRRSTGTRWTSVPLTTDTPALATSGAIGRSAMIRRTACAAPVGKFGCGGDLQRPPCRQ